MIDFELYRVFKIVADEENLTKASKKLYISQPAITKHIKNLEKELNVELFTRSKYGMILNENGKKLYLQIKDSIENLSKADLIFNNHKNIKLGIHVNMPERIYNNSILKFYEENNKDIINIHKLDATNMFLALEKQEIDLAFSKKYSEEIYDSNKINFISIGKLHDVFIVNKNSKYLGKKITKDEIKTNKVYTLKKFSSAYQNLAKEYGNEYIENIINVDFAGIIELFKSRDIIAAITKEYVEDKIKNDELAVLDVDLKLDSAEYGIYYNINNKYKELNSLIEVFKNTSKI